MTKLPRPTEKRLLQQAVNEAVCPEEAFKSLQEDLINVLSLSDECLYAGVRYDQATQN